MGFTCISQHNWKLSLKVTATQVHTQGKHHHHRPGKHCCNRPSQARPSSQCESQHALCPAADRHYLTTTTHHVVRLFPQPDHKKYYATIKCDTDPLVLKKSQQRNSKGDKRTSEYFRHIHMYRNLGNFCAKNYSCVKCLC